MSLLFFVGVIGEGRAHTYGRSQGLLTVMTVQAFLRRNTLIVLLSVIVGTLAAHAGQSKPASESLPLPVGANLPALEAQSLDDQPVVLPSGATGRTCVLLLTFSRSAGEIARAWQEQLIKDFPDPRTVFSYSIALLGDAPGFVRGMIRSAMRKGTPPTLRERTLTSTVDSKVWKARVDCKNDKEVYLLLLNGKGQIVWMRHSPDFNTRVYEDFKKAMERRPL